MPLMLALACAALSCRAPTSDDASADELGSEGTTTSASESSGGSTEGDGDGETTTSSESEGDTTEGSSGPKLDMPAEEPLPDGCVQLSTDSMFLLDAGGMLHRFDPEQQSVAPLGQLACPGVGAALGLAMDRSGLLWALMLDDLSNRVLVTVDPETLACTPTAFADPLPNGFAAYALAFGADAVDAAEETLYLAGLASTELFPSPDAPALLGRVDPDTFAVTTVGVIPLANDASLELCDLKGSGDARLYAMCSTLPATLAELDELDAAVLVDDAAQVELGSSAALGLWEGDLWLFTGTGPEGRTQVHVHALGGTTTTLIDDLGMVVVGVANSTCVPYEPVG